LPTEHRAAASCERLVKIYRAGTGEVHALRGIDARFAAGTVTAVVGPSGAGKSSLLRILAGLDRPTGGRVQVGDQELTRLTPARARRLRRRHIGYVFQKPADNLIAHLRVDEHLQHAASLRGVEQDAIDDLCRQLGIDHRLRHRPRELSGGEQQRVAVAQAVVGRPDVLIADEPTAELDSATGRALMDAVADLRGTGTAVIVSTHDEVVVQAADTVLALRHGALESETRQARSLAVIDEGGRIQLPEAALQRFPDRRALLEISDDGVWLRPPDPGAGERS
jgi:putative ABC transport system ATP-binding protein